MTRKEIATLFETSETLIGEWIRKAQKDGKFKNI